MSVPMLQVSAGTNYEKRQAAGAYTNNRLILRQITNAAGWEASPWILPVT